MKKPPAKTSAAAGAEELSEKPSVVAEWSGPLPPPSILQNFDTVVDGGAERIFSAWESETAHRRDMEKRDLTIAGVDAILGKIFAFLFVMAALGVCVVSLMMGHEWVAAILGGGTITSVVSAFAIVNRKHRGSGDS